MGEWQKIFVNKLVEQVGLTHTDAMKVMGIVCDIRSSSYMEGYERGSRSMEAPTRSDDTRSAQNSLQQLKAEIAAVVEQLKNTDSSKPLSSICDAIKRLRQLLAV